MQFHLTFPTFSFVRPAYFFKKTVLLFEAMAIWCLRRRKYRKTKREFWSAPRDWRRNWEYFVGNVTMNGFEWTCAIKENISWIFVSSLRYVFGRFAGNYGGKFKQFNNFYVLYIRPDRDPKFRFNTRFNLGLFRSARFFDQFLFIWNSCGFNGILSCASWFYFPTLSSHD